MGCNTSKPSDSDGQSNMRTIQNIPVIVANEKGIIVKSNHSARMLFGDELDGKDTAVLTGP